MDSLPQTVLFILTLVCGLSCGLLILAMLALYLLGRLDIVRDLFSGLRSAARDDETPDQEGLMDDRGAAYTSRHRSDVAQRVAAARARADREFRGPPGESPPAGGIDPAPDDVPPDELEGPSHKAHYKRRFREENPDLDDEVDSYFDDTEL